MVIRFLLIWMIPLAGAAEAYGQVRWAAEFDFSLPVNIPSPLTMRQNGKQAVRMVAVWSARSFNLPLNWMWRVERWNDATAWGFETVHHKMVLQNRPDHVQWLSLTHGFNTLTIDRAWEIQKLVLRAGAGIVLTHPESTIDNTFFPDQPGFLGLGYYLTGPVFMTSLARPIHISRVFMINLEGKITAGYANVPIVDGRAQLLHLAFHLHAGLGFSVRGRSAVNRAGQYVLPKYEI